MMCVKSSEKSVAASEQSHVTMAPKARFIVQCVEEANCSLSSTILTLQRCHNWSRLISSKFRDVLGEYLVGMLRILN